MTIRRKLMHTHQTRARFVALVLSVAALASATPLAAQGGLHELYCRGVRGINLKVDQDPSPRDTAYVVMVLEYKRPTTPPGDDIHRLEPGTCTWNPTGFPGVLVEPGRVRFDVMRQAQRWSDPGTREIDTTKRAAAFFPDPITLPRYLGDPINYWKFFVNDATNLSTIHGAYFEPGLPTYTKIKGPLVLANDVRRDLLCRGGSAGLRFGGGGTVGDNLARVFLSYRVSPTVPGPAGYGLSPGACSWTDRTAMPPEPGTISFVTARNAQIKQAQSGSIDRTPTAAERYPDVFTIPEYLKDPSHYWTFAVMSRKPDSALTNGPWKRDLTAVIATGRPTATSTSVSLPSSVTGGGEYRPGGAGSTTSITSVFDIKNVVVSPTLDNLVIGFQAAPGIVPVVTVTPAAGGSPVTIPVQGSAQGTMWRYVGSSKTPLARNTQYNYTISAPASANARANTKSGAFKTLGQSVTVAFTQIYLVSDGDGDSNGELTFAAQTCPRPYLLSPVQLGKKISAPLDWGDGPHRIDEKMTSYKDTVPDRFRVVVVGIEEDIGSGGLPGLASSPDSYSYCDGNGPEPGANRNWDWNSIMFDFDLTKYPGAKGGEQFYRRSKALRNGASLMFEVRGYIQVIRQ